MKRTRVVAIILSLLCCSALFSACGKNENYLSDVNENLHGYNASFNVMYGENVELHVETSVGDSKEKVAALLSIIEGDYARIDRVFGIRMRVKCYVVSDLYDFGKSKAVYSDGAVILDGTALSSDEYELALSAAYIGSTEPWKQIGAHAHVFGSEYDNARLKEYYADENDHKLTLFAAYFSDAFSSDRAVAVETARSFGDFVIENYGFERFISANLTDYRREYLEFLGINRAFNVPFDLSWLDGAEYSLAQNAYPLVIGTPNRIYNLAPFSAPRDTASFMTPERVLYHLSAGNEECEKILNYVNENATECYDFISKRYASNLEYFISEQEIKTCCDVGSGKIYLRDPSEFVHETVHAITMKANPEGNAWLGEGVAEYLSRYVSKHISDVNIRFYSSFTDKTLSESLSEFVGDVNALYSRNGGGFENIEAFDFALMIECIGKVTLETPSHKTRIEFPYATDPIYKFYACTNKDGNALTYPEAYAFTKYLIDKYGLTSVLRCVYDYDPEKFFGSPYSALLNDYLLFEKSKTKNF